MFTQAFEEKLCPCGYEMQNGFCVACGEKTAECTCDCSYCGLPMYDCECPKNSKEAEPEQ